MKKVIIDAEFNGLQPTKLHCIVCKDVDTGDIHEFSKGAPRGASLRDFYSYADNVDRWIGHNIIQFDAVWLNLLLDEEVIDWKKCIDTLVVSRLINYNKTGGHSVENWGKDFGLDKKFIDDWENLPMDEYVERCKYDVEIQHKIFKSLKKWITSKSWARGMRVEHDMAWICHDMHENGFAFDKDRAEELLAQINKEMSELEEQITTDIPPVLQDDGVIKLKVNKDATPSKRTMDNVGFPAAVSDGAEWHRFSYRPFNPGSAKDRINYLNSVGWRPTEKTKGHINCERQVQAIRYKMNRWSDWKKQLKRKELEDLEERLASFRKTGWRVNETNLDTLPANAPRGGRLLAAWLTLEGRRGDLEEWLTAYRPETGRIHGSFNGIGAWTHRMSHVRPNKGNIFSSFSLDECKGDVPTPVEDVKIRYNGQLRGLWKAGGNRLLVGTDAEGIQLRILAHYINDPEFTEAIVNGRKEDGTDVHSLNRRKLGEVCRSRADSKTFIYAWLLGAGVGKVAEILGCSQTAARAAVEYFIEDTPGLAELKRSHIPADAKRGYFDGLDGRKVICKHERLFLTGYLQNGESVVMKHANVKWRKWADEAGLDYKQVDFVHDEWVTEVPDEATAHEIGRLQCLAIETTGKDLGLNCALAGEYKIGKNWLEVH